MFALVVAGTIVFTMSGYARDPGSSRTANRRRAYIVVSILTIVVVLPLIANTIYTVLHARWSAEIGAAAEDWLADEDRALAEDVTWNGLVATIVVTDSDGVLPPIDDLTDALSGLPEMVSVVVDVGVGDEIPVR